MLLVASVVFAVGFVWIEYKLVEMPIIPMRLFKVRNVSIACLVMFNVGFVMMSLIFYLPVWFEVIT